MKKLLSIVLTIAMLFTMVACIPVSAAEGEEVIVDTSTLGDYYKFTFGEDGDRYDYTVANKNVDDTTGQLTYKGNSFYPLWIDSADAANAEVGYKTITTNKGENFDVLEVKSFANGWLVPLTKEGKPFEFTPGVKYNVNIKFFNPACNTWGQSFIGAGTTNNKTYAKANGITYTINAETGEMVANPKTSVYSTIPYNFNVGGTVSGNSYSFYATEGTYGTSGATYSCVHSQFKDAEGNPLTCTSSKYVNAYLDRNAVLAIPEEAGIYNEEKGSYDVKATLNNNTPDDTSDDTEVVGNNYFAMSFSGGNVYAYGTNSSYHVYTNDTVEEGEKIPSTWQIVSIEIVSENYKSSLSYSVNGEIVKTVEAGVGTAIEAFVPEIPEGKFFAGWYADEALTVPYTAEAIEYGQKTVYAKFFGYGENVEINFDDGNYPATAVFYDEAGTKWPLRGYSWKGNTYKYGTTDSVLKTTDNLIKELEAKGYSGTPESGTISFFSDRTWGMPGGITFANPDGSLFVPKAGEMYKVTYKYRSLLNNDKDMSINVVYGLLDAMGNLTTTGDKTFFKKTLAYNTIEEVVTEWTEKSATVVIPEEGEGYIPALGLSITGVAKAKVFAEDGETVIDYTHTMVELDYVKVEKVPTTTVTYVALDGTEKTEMVEIGAEIKYHALGASRNNDIVWSLSKDSFVAAPKIATEAITVYEYASDVISFENYASADYIKHSLNLQVSEDYALTGSKSLKYVNLGYSITSAKPSDWDTNWTKYYVFVDGEFVQLAGDAAPEWVAGTYLQSRGNNNLEQAVALWSLPGNKTYKISFKYYIPEALAGDVELYPYTAGSNIWWNNNGDGKGTVHYKDSAITIGADAKVGEWVDGEIYFTSTAIEKYDYLLVKVGTTATDKMVMYFDDFSYEEVEAVTFEIPEGATAEGYEAVDNIVTVYVAKGGTAIPPVVTDADGNIIEVWYNANGEEVTEFPAGAYTYQSFIYGDCDGNKEIDTTDLAMLKLKLAGIGEVGPGADCNGDGELNTTDLAMLKLNLAGIGTLGPAQ
ncbi:MAG: dockerin type I repeat-containing protein [Clostridia bacterium]|nr:dockerin type I repeat-containing protein [Clostridia bacterium]